MFTFSDALIIAIEAHKGVKDAGGIDYIKHPLYIYHKIKMKGGSNEAQMVAILHDTVEDSEDVTIEGLRNFGCPESVLEALELMTHIPDKDFIERHIARHMETGIYDFEEAKVLAKEEEYYEYIERLSKNDIARMVKIEDLRHNSDIRRIPESVYTNKLKMRRFVKYAKALKMLTGGKVGYC